MNSDRQIRAGSAPTPLLGASSEAIRRLYDLSDEFFQLWLDPEMIYSCALFQETSDLAAARLLKLDHHIEAAGAAGAPVAWHRPSC